MESNADRISQTSKLMFVSMCFQLVLEFLEYEQQVQIQIMCRVMYDFTVPRFLRNRQMTIRPDFVFFDFSSIRQQIQTYQNQCHSSEAKSSDDDFGKFFYSRVWFFNSLAENPWTFTQVSIPPSISTKGGFKTIITNKRFRCFLVGGSNSR